MKRFFSSSKTTIIPISQYVGDAPKVIERRYACDICYDENKTIKIMRCDYVDETTKIKCNQVWFVCSQCRELNFAIRNTNCLVCSVELPPPPVIIDIPESAIYSDEEFVIRIKTLSNILERVYNIVKLILSLCLCIFVTGIISCGGLCESNSIIKTLWVGFQIFSSISVLVFVFCKNRR